MISTSYRLETEEVSVGQVDICRGAGLDPKDTTSDRLRCGAVAQQTLIDQPGLVGCSRDPALVLAAASLTTDGRDKALTFSKIRDRKRILFLFESRWPGHRFISINIPHSSQALSHSSYNYREALVQEHHISDLSYYPRIPDPYPLFFIKHISAKI